MIPTVTFTLKYIIFFILADLIEHDHSKGTISSSADDLTQDANKEGFESLKVKENNEDRRKVSILIFIRK